MVFAAFAKTVELTFVTVFVAFLGQVLTTRAMKNHVKGVTLADMSMRSWIMQPGTIFTHWETLRYSALTFIGILTLTGTLTAMLYTTASDALGKSWSYIRERARKDPFSYVDFQT